MLKDVRGKVATAVIAARFHRAMADIVVKTVKKISRRTGTGTVALSGGVFQNRLLKEVALKKLAAAGLKVYMNEKYPVNDLNISLGQYYVSGGSGKN